MKTTTEFANPQLLLFSSEDALNKLLADSPRVRLVGRVIKQLGATGQVWALLDQHASPEEKERYAEAERVRDRAAKLSYMRAARSHTKLAKLI